jgi:hypothetical protein
MAGLGGEPARARAGEAGLLLQFAHGGGDGVLAGVHHAAGDFEGDVVRAEAELPDEHELATRGDGEDVDPVGRVDEEEVTRGGMVGVVEIHTLDVEDAGRSDGAASELFPALRFLRRRRHAGGSATKAWFANPEIARGSGHSGKEMGNSVNQEMTVRVFVRSCANSRRCVKSFSADLPDCFTAMAQRGGAEQSGASPTCGRGAPTPRVAWHSRHPSRRKHADARRIA